MTAAAYPLTWPGCATYGVSRSGDVFRIFRTRPPKKLAVFTDQDGYPYVQITVDGRRRKLRLHRAVMETYGEPRPTPNHVIRLMDGDRENSNFENLAWGTPQEVADDREARGRTARGARNGSYTKPHKRRYGTDNGNSKLTPVEIARIRADARFQYLIARDFGVSQSLISVIKRHEIWRDPSTKTRAEALKEIGG